MFLDVRQSYHKYSIHYTVSTSFVMPAFSRFIAGQRGSQQLVDTDGYIYSRKRPRDTITTSTWRCSKNNLPTKCPCHCYLNLADNTLSLGSKPHNHEADLASPHRREVLTALKRKAEQQPLLASQHLVLEFLTDSSPEVKETLPNKESLTRLVQRSRAAVPVKHTETENMAEGYHRGLETNANQPKLDVLEYSRATKEEHVITEYPLDRLSVGGTPSKKRRSSRTQLYDLCTLYSTYFTGLGSLFAEAKNFAHNIE